MELNTIMLVYIFYKINFLKKNYYLYYSIFISNNISKTNDNKKLETLEKKRLNALKKIESLESKLNILESHRWNPMDSKYSNYLINYCISQLNMIINKLRNERNEYFFKTAYLYDKNHKGK